MRLLIALLLLILPQPVLAQPGFAPSPVSEAEARAFITRQEGDWNAGRLQRYFESFTPDAIFTDQAYVGRKPPVPYGSSSREEARTNASRVFARKPWPRETHRVLRVQGEAGGALRVTAVVGSTIWEDGRARRLCATRQLVLVRRGESVRAASRTDTFVKCREG